MKIEGETKDKLIRAYKAFHRKVMDERRGSGLSKEEAKAIGVEVINDLTDGLLDRDNLTDAERKEALEEVRNVIRENFSDNLWDTSLVYDRHTFSKKDENV